MLAGVLCFIVAYTSIEGTTWYQSLRRRPFVRATLYLGYGTRIVLSILFPIGGLLDFYAGVLSVGLLTDAFGAPSRGPNGWGFGPVFATTLFQGLLLNLMLLGFMCVVYSIACAVCDPNNDWMRPDVRAD